MTDEDLNTLKSILADYMSRITVAESINLFLLQEWILSKGEGGKTKSEMLALEKDARQRLGHLAKALGADDAAARKDARERLARYSDVVFSPLKIDACYRKVRADN